LREEDVLKDAIVPALVVVIVGILLNVQRQIVKLQQSVYVIVRIDKMLQLQREEAL
jgi:hypothetical protein